MKKKCWRTKLLAFDGNGLNPASVSATKKVLDLSMVIIQGEKKKRNIASTHMKQFLENLIHPTNKAFNSKATSFQQLGLISLSLSQIHKRKQGL